MVPALLLLHESHVRMTQVFSGDLRHCQASTWTTMAAHDYGDQGISWQDTGVPPAKVTLWSTLVFQMHTGWKSHWQTEAALSPCAKCAGKAGLCESWRFLSNPGTRAGLPSPPPTGTPGPATWEELVLYSSCWRQSMAQGIRCTGHQEYAVPARLCWSAGSPQRSHAGLLLPTASWGCWAV